ncbi:hypothetical protein CA983_26035 [Streptomyces swartbergensis]|uniref:Uncharacterized protein n=1 Tax=Streptomyces swartbergensis TaxID=487165 RepID=A0A243RYQ7_9ACTN|nr:hypothetical protein CA983_26035 [Streptomyces swartbergensis]
MGGARAGGHRGGHPPSMRTGRVTRPRAPRARHAPGPRPAATASRKHRWSCTADDRPPAAPPGSRAARPAPEICPCPCPCPCKGVCWTGDADGPGRTTRPVGAAGLSPCAGRCSRSAGPASP